MPQDDKYKCSNQIRARAQQLLDQNTQRNLAQMHSYNQQQCMAYSLGSYKMNMIGCVSYNKLGGVPAPMNHCIHATRKQYDSALRKCASLPSAPVRGPPIKVIKSIPIKRNYSVPSSNRSSVVIAKSVGISRKMPCIAPANSRGPERKQQFLRIARNS